MKGAHRSKLAKGKTKTPIPLVIAGVVFAALLFLTFQFRETIFPWAIERVYGNQAERVYQEEFEKLQDPLALLGYQAQDEQFWSSHCSTLKASGLKTQVDCVRGVSVYQQIDKNPERREALRAGAEKLQSLLQANGWQGEYSDEDLQKVSLVKLVSNVDKGVAYKPDATYEKRVGKVVCYLHSNTAYSQPGKDAFATQIDCSRTFNILGEPSLE